MRAQTVFQTMGALGSDGMENVIRFSLILLSSGKASRAMASASCRKCQPSFKSRDRQASTNLATPADDRDCFLGLYSSRKRKEGPEMENERPA